ncbi:unnamed protein product [Cunninghamella echinulata]
MNDLNQNQLIPGAYFTIVYKDSFPDSGTNQQISVTNAVYASVTLMQHGVIGVIGDISSSWTSLSALMSSTLSIPQCSFSSKTIALSDKSQYKYFFRTIPTQVIFADVMLSFATLQGWSKVGVIYPDSTLGQQFFQRAIIQADTQGLEIIQAHSFDPNLDVKDITFALQNITQGNARVIVVAATDREQSSLMIQAASLGYLTNDYTWLLLGLNDIQLQNDVKKYNQQNPSNPIDYNTTFNGIFMFDNWLSLNGYPPYEHFLKQWSTLDSRSYPKAGVNVTSANEGLAYSCMMVMANGFKNILSSQSEQNDTLKRLAGGDLGSSMLPQAFNVSYVGPSGPMIYDSNGDLSISNFLIYNLQQGISVNIGHSLSGKMELTHPPMFHDGSIKPPADAPPSIALNPTYLSPISLGIISICSLGILLSIFTFIIVLAFRKNEIFRASSPLFCCLELIGIILTFAATIERIDQPTQLTCYLAPITFNLGFLLVLGNMIAKNYRIYRIFNNVFITRNVITDLQLVKSTSIVVVTAMVILTVGLAVTQPRPTRVIVTSSTYYWECSTNSNYRLVFQVILSTYAAIMLCVATYLAYKTRLAGKQYSRYNECKQMGLSVYNILFSALIGYSALMNPLADFYVRFYMGTFSILWATFFTWAVLFVPKLYTFFRQQVENSKRTSPSSSDRHRTQNNDYQPSFLKPIEENEMKDIKSASHCLSQDDEQDEHKYLQLIQEGEMPVRKVFRYFPFLSQWQMQRIMVFPWLGYVSHFSESKNHGTVMNYSHATMEMEEMDSYVLKIHGQGWYDLYIQVANKETMSIWLKCFQPSSHQTTLNHSLMDPLCSNKDELDFDDDDDEDHRPDSILSHDLLLVTNKNKIKKQTATATTTNNNII